MQIPEYRHGDRVACDGMQCHIICDNGDRVVVSVVASGNELKGEGWSEVDRWVWRKEVSKTEVTRID